MCSLVVLLDKSNIALSAPKFTCCPVGGDTFEAVKGEQYSDHSAIEVLLLYVCPRVVLLNKSDSALFAFKNTF